ncbi:MAG: alpha/beta hydrolase [Gammaproteobacteria bacterium]
MRLSGLLLLSLCAAIAGCDKAEDGLETKTGLYSLFDPAATNPSLCAAPAIPFPNNALFASATSATGVTTDTTLNIPSAASTAVAANLTDGYSTTASAFTDILGVVDFASAANAIVILEADATPRILQFGTDYTLQPSIALSQISGTGGCALDATVNTGAARFLPISQQRTRILIEWLRPLNPSTNYIIAVTKDLLSVDGVPATTNEFFPIVNTSTRLCRLSPGGVPEAGTEPICGDPATPALLAASVAPVLGTLTAITPNPAGGAPLTGAAAAAVRLTTLETLRRNLVRPTVQGFFSLANAILDPDLTDNDLVIAWSFTTQSVGATLQTLNAIATAKTFAVANTGLSTGDLGLGLPDVADIFAGTLNAVPYYLDDAASANDFASQCIGTTPGVSCNGFWANNGAVTSTANGGFVPWTPLADYDGPGPLPVTPAPCTTGVPPFNWVAPLSTTNCHRIPLERSQENLLVLVTVPNVNSGQTKPVAGWPVVIFQHGITGNRTQALPIVPALAAQGFVVVSIDLPLHGLVPAASVATCGALATNGFYVPGGVERTFELDLVNNVSGAFVPDGIVDCSGTHMINLASLTTSRDNLRQAVADQIHLIKSLRAADPMNLDGAAGDDIDENRIHFAGISLGSIVGTTLLGVDTGASATLDEADEAIIAASLSVPGGALGKLLDASATFGPRIAAGLAGNAFPPADLAGSGSPFEGTDTYETFVRFAQHLVDPADPINFAVSANANHRIHMTEVLNDTVVPNNAMTTCPAAEDLPAGIGSTPAANNTNAATRDAACDAAAALVGSNAATAALCPDVPTIATTKLCNNPTGFDEVLLSGFLSGTTPLYTEMGLTQVTVTPPATVTNQTCAGLDIAVQFQIGSHGSLLDPTASAVTTVEMQRQAAIYFRNDGGSLGTDCP